jgi:hypothetical protein
LTEVWFRGEFQFQDVICPACQAICDLDLALLRGEFYGLLDRGLDRRVANRVMEIRVDELFRKGVFSSNYSHDRRYS